MAARCTGPQVSTRPWWFPPGPRRASVLKTGLSQVRCVGQSLPPSGVAHRCCSSTVPRTNHRRYRAGRGHRHHRPGDAEEGTTHAARTPSSMIDARCGSVNAYSGVWRRSVAIQKLRLSPGIAMPAGTRREHSAGLRWKAVASPEGTSPVRERPSSPVPPMSPRARVRNGRTVQSRWSPSRPPGYDLLAFAYSLNWGDARDDAARPREYRLAQQAAHSSRAKLPTRRYVRAGPGGLAPPRRSCRHRRVLAPSPRSRR